MACKPQEDESNGWKAGCKLNVESEAGHKNLADHALDHIPTNNHQHGESTDPCPHSRLSVGVHTSEDIVHTKISHKDTEERQQHEYMIIPGISQ